MQKRHFLIAALALLVSVSTGSAQTADTIFHNGKVLTVDKSFTVAQAVAVSGTKILAVGTDAEVMKLAGPNTVKIDMKGRSLIPGLINTHVHLENVGSYASELGAMKNREFALKVRGLKTKD